MVAISLGSFIFLLALLVVSIGGILIAFPSITPRLFCSLFIFGKVRRRRTWSLNSQDFFLVPKSWFTHFYAVGMMNAGFWILVLVNRHWTGQIPEVVQMVLQLIRYPFMEGTADMFPCYIVLACIAIQVTRRFTECMVVSVYSKDGKMSFITYLIGIAFYTGLTLVCVAGSNLSQEVKLRDFSTQVGLMQCLGLSMFVSGSWLQNWTARKFAELRCNKQGAVVNDKHHIPEDGMFEYITCPHYLAEIIIYFSMTTMFAFKNPMINCVALFVLSNQFISAHYTHKWYRETFDKYPKDRKALLPYLL